MPNIKSAEKRVSVIAKKKLINKMVRSQMNTSIKKFNAAVSGNDVELARTLLPLASSKVDEAAKKGVIHKNAANRKKSQLGKALYQLEHGIIVIKVDNKTLKQTEQKAAAVRKAEEEKAIRAERTEKRIAKEAAKTPAPKKETKKPAVKKEKTETEQKAPAKKAKVVKEAVVEDTAETGDEIK